MRARPTSTRSTIERRGLAAFVVLSLVGALLATPHAGAQTGELGAFDAQGPAQIEQIVLNDNGVYRAQNSSATSVVDADDDPVEIVSITVNQGGELTILDDINLGPVTIEDLNVPAAQSGYWVYENGTTTARSSAGFAEALARNLVSADLRDYQITDHVNVTWGGDWDAMYGAPFHNDDFVIVAERWGNSDMELGALGADGELIAGSDRITIGSGEYTWNTGYAPGNRTTQPMWMSVFDIEAFGVDTDSTPIFGFRYFNGGEADIKIWGASYEPFTEVCPPGAPINDVPAAQTGPWTRVNSTTYRASFGDTFVTARVAGDADMQTAVMDRLDTNDYSVSTVRDADALEVIHWFPNDATLTFEFDDPVVDPSIHMARIGGYSGWGDVVWSHSSRVNLGGGLSWTETAANGPHFETTSTRVWRTTGTLLDPALRTGNIGAWNWGMAGGSVEIEDTVTSIPLTLSAVGFAFDDGTGDGIEYVLTKPAVEGCGGVTEVDVRKSSNTRSVNLGGEIEWNLHTLSTGTADVEGLEIIDSIADGLDAQSLRTGRWEPSDARAAFSVRVDGLWITLGTVDGTDDATYALPYNTDQVKVEYLDNLPPEFEATTPVTLVTTVEGANSGGELPPVCYAVSGDSASLITFDVDRLDPVPAAIAPLSRQYDTNAMAFWPSEQKLIVWSDIGGDQDAGLYMIDPATGFETTITESFDEQLAGFKEVEGAAFEVTDAGQEILWAVIETNDHYIYRIDPATGAPIGSRIGPISGPLDKPSSLAIDPTTGTWYVTEASGTRRIGTIDPTSGATTAEFLLDGNPDVGGLDFATDGLVYAEDEDGDLVVLNIDLGTGAMTEATSALSGVGDIDAIACNGGSSTFHELELSVDNCATWTAVDMSSRGDCETVGVETVAAKPALQVWNETGSAGPGEPMSFKVRVENLNSAARPYVEPFVGVLLPAGLDYFGWEPVSAGTAPTITVVDDHNSTGRTLVRFDFERISFQPGDLYDVRLIAAVRNGADAGSETIEFGTSTNDATYVVEHTGETAADISDIDSDGILAEVLGSAAADFEIESVFEMEATAWSRGTPGLDFIDYDGTTDPTGSAVALDDIATGLSTTASNLPDLDTGKSLAGSNLAIGQEDPLWTVATQRTSNYSPADVVGECNSGFPAAPAVAIWDRDCDSRDDRWFKRTFDLLATSSPEDLMLKADVWLNGDFTIYVNGVEQNQNGSGFDNDILLTGPFVPGENVIEIHAEGENNDHSLAIDFTWARAADADTPGVERVDLNESASHTQRSTGTWGSIYAKASLAGDGDNSANFWSGSMSHTSGTSHQWWQADLHTVAAIDEVTIWNRGDCCASRIEDATLFVSTSPFTSHTISGMRAQTGVVEFPLDGAELVSGSTTVSLGDVEARYVRVALNGQYLHMAEVDIYGHIVEIADSTIIDDDWTVSDTLNGARRPAVLVEEGGECSTPWNTLPGNADLIWFDSCTDEGTAYFHREFEIEAADEPATLIGEIEYVVDNQVLDVFVNGVRQDVAGAGWSSMNTAELSGPFLPGMNTITIQATNLHGPAGLAASFDWSRLPTGCPDDDGFTNRPCIAQVESHDEATLRFDLDNVGNAGGGGAVIYGSLPFYGDTMLISGADRNSDLATTLISEVEVIERPTAASVTVQYSTSTNPCRPEVGGEAPGTAWPVGCDMDWGDAPDDLGEVTAVRIVVDTATGSNWEGGERLQVELDVRAAQGSYNRDEYAWMSWAYQLETAGGTLLTPVETLPAGLVVPQSQNGIGDLVWLDANRDGVQDPTEAGVNGVAIELYDSNRDLVATTTSQNLDNDTDQPGFYWFGDLEPGQYYIKLVRVPIAWNIMTPDIGDESVDSDVSPLTFESTLFTVEETGLVTGVDVGFFIPRGPAVCDDGDREFDPTDTDQDRREVPDATQCPG